MSESTALECKFCGKVIVRCSIRTRMDNQPEYSPHPEKKRVTAVSPFSDDDEYSFPVSIWCPDCKEETKCGSPPDKEEGE